MSRKKLPDFYSPSTRGFYREDLHGKAIPADAVAVSAAAKRALMEAQAAGADIRPDPRGRPVAHLPVLGIADRRAALVARLKREARRRIEAIAPAWRQANDNAAIAQAALEQVMLGAVATDFIPAIERRKAIDAIRAASNRIEKVLVEGGADVLGAFDPTDDEHWSI